MEYPLCGLVPSSTNAEEGLVNSSSVVTYLDIGWTCGEMAHSILLRLPDVDHLVAQLRLVALSPTCTCGLSGNVPLLHMSTQHPDTSLHTIRFTRPSPVLVL